MKTKNNETESSNKHKNYEILNLIGYGLSKFDNTFIQEFGFTTKNAFYNYCTEIKIAETIGTVKNRMDLFDIFFQNGRKGWWQKGNAYIHRKIMIDSLFGNESVTEYANIVKLYLKEQLSINEIIINENPIIKSRFKQLQQTGFEAEMYFMQNFNTIDIFHDGSIEDARLYGDGYDFQINVNKKFYLAEVKGVREKKGKFRMTENEYHKAKEYQNDYVIALILNLNDIPVVKTIINPVNNLDFEKKEIITKTQIEYQVTDIISY